MHPQMANYIANFVSREPSIDGDRHVVKPELASRPPARTWMWAGSPPSFE